MSSTSKSTKSNVNGNDTSTATAGCVTGTRLGFNCTRDDIKKALQWFHRGARRGCVTGAHNVGVMMYSLREILPREDVEFIDTPADCLRHLPSPCSTLPASSPISGSTPTVKDRGLLWLRYAAQNRCVASASF